MIKPGDKVSIKLKDEALEGILIKTPTLLDSNTIILKLDSGYNIGIDKEKIISMNLIKEGKIIKKEKRKLTINSKLKNITILSTGGTISSKVDYNTGGVTATYTAEDFVEMCPELEQIANIKAKKVMEIMSEDMNQKDWEKLTEHIKEELKNSDGVVVTMGTDTLGYTAAALSFSINTNKPVILTAAQRSIDRGSSDGFFNLICSVKAATELKGVSTCMHGSSSDDFCSIIRGTKVRKMHSSKRDAFQPINDSLLAKVTPKNIELIDDKIYESFGEKFSEDCSLIYIHPGITNEFIDSIKSKGVILMGTGFGHIPNNIYDSIKRLVDRSLFVGMTTQCIFGRTSSTVYSPLRIINKMGVIYLEDMLPETAFVKLCWCIGKTTNKEKIKELMTTNLTGEITNRTLLD